MKIIQEFAVFIGSAINKQSQREAGFVDTAVLDLPVRDSC
jgi:hypothetical protein